MSLLRKKKKEVIDSEDRLLLEALFNTQQELKAIRSRFEYATEPEMVSSCIFELRSAQERYSFLLNQIRLRNITLENRGQLAAQRE